MKLTTETPWKVTTVSGAAGGASRKADVLLRIETLSDTVEEVRELVEALPKMLGALREAQHAVEYYHIHEGAETLLADVNAALALAQDSDPFKTLREVETKLNAHGMMKAFVEYPGYLRVRCKGYSWCFGTANETWDGYRVNDQGESEQGTERQSAIPSTSEDVGAIVKFIIEAISR